MTEDTLSEEACNNGRNIWVTFYNSYNPFDRPNVSGWKEASSEQEVIDFSYTTDPAACPTVGAYYLGTCEYHNGSTTGGDSGWWYDAYEAQCEEFW